MAEDNGTFERFGKSYQERVVVALLQDSAFAEQMSDVLDPRYFTVDHLGEVTKRVFDHLKRFKAVPTASVIEMQVRQDDGVDGTVTDRASEFLARVPSFTIDKDLSWVQENSLDFCRKQAVVRAMEQMLDQVERCDYGSMHKSLNEALEKGAPRDTGHEYSDGFDVRTKKSVRSPLSTGWPVIDRELGGGWERGTLATFIAPTGAGKSMFLVNVSAAAVAAGLKVVYFTLEMADFKIGLRHDSYYAGVEINDVPKHPQRVRDAISGLKGRLIIKEFPTKRAGVQTLRAHLQRLKTSKDFTPDIVVLDYADLLRGSGKFGEKRHELEGVYEELRGMAQEFNVALITADQTNRAGLNEEVVTVASIGESYAKATVCDLIMTISRRAEDKQSNMGRLFIAKSRLGRDGTVFNFLMNPATVKVRVLDQSDDLLEALQSHGGDFKRRLGERIKRMAGEAPADQ